MHCRYSVPRSIFYVLFSGLLLFSPLSTLQAFQLSVLDANEQPRADSTFKRSEAAFYLRVTYLPDTYNGVERPFLVKQYGLMPDGGTQITQETWFNEETESVNWQVDINDDSGFSVYETQLGEWIYNFEVYDGSGRALLWSQQVSVFIENDDPTQRYDIYTTVSEGKPPPPHIALAPWQTPRHTFVMGQDEKVTSIVHADYYYNPIRFKMIWKWYGKRDTGKVAKRMYSKWFDNRDELPDGYLTVSTHYHYPLAEMFEEDKQLAALPAEKIKLEKTLIWCDSKKKLS